MKLRSNIHQETDRRFLNPENIPTIPHAASWNSWGGGGGGVSLDWIFEE